MKKDNGRTARRAQIRRILHISERIKAGDYPNCGQMADELKASQKTVTRDLEFMRDELQLPIDYNESRRGYYYTKASNKLFGAGIGTKEIQDLVEANAVISEYVGTPMEPLMREAFAQLKQDLGLGQAPAGSLHGIFSFRPFAPVIVDFKMLQTVGAALRRRRGLQFKYQAPGKEVVEERHGVPRYVCLINNCWYLILFCLRDRDDLVFPIHRISEPVMTAQRFKGSKKFDIDAFLRDRWIVAAGSEIHEVIVELDEWATDVVRCRYIPSRTDLIELPGRRSRAHFRVSTLDEIEMHIRLLGIHATVLEPPALVERMRNTVRELAKRYGV